MKTVKNRALKYIIRTYGTQMLNDAYDNVEATETDDRTIIDVEHDIAENANSEDFIVADAEVVDSVKDGVEKSVGTNFDVEVPTKDERKISTDAYVPDFMKN